MKWSTYVFVASALTAPCLALPVAQDPAVAGGQLAVDPNAAAPSGAAAPAPVAPVPAGQEMVDAAAPPTETAPAPIAPAPVQKGCKPRYGSEAAPAAPAPADGAEAAPTEQDSPQLEARFFHELKDKVKAKLGFGSDEAKATESGAPVASAAAVPTDAADATSEDSAVAAPGASAPSDVESEDSEDLEESTEEDATTQQQQAQAQFQEQRDAARKQQQQQQTGASAPQAPGPAGGNTPVGTPMGTTPQKRDINDGESTNQWEDEESSTTGAGAGLESDNRSSFEHTAESPSRFTSSLSSEDSLASEEAGPEPEAEVEAEDSFRTTRTGPSGSSKMSSPSMNEVEDEEIASSSPRGTSSGSSTLDAESAEESIPAFTDRTDDVETTEGFEAPSGHIANSRTEEPDF